MANEVKLTIRVGDDGSLDVVAKKAEQAAKATDKVTSSTDNASKARNRYNKLEKGTAQLGANTTKSFAKQASIIGGGLVPAYATLAANVFAITAAFNALKSADAFRLLEEGLNRVGAAAGKNLPYVADRLRDITGAAVSSQQAMEAVALGTASGFSQEQLEGLASVARGASVALGRDMTDALSRLTRGAAKLEPEILDELGIMVRLDDATTAYAASLGKTSDQLSILERRQAFTNAILEQGTKKYGAIAESIDPSPYDRLAAAFDSLSKGFLQLINKGVTPFLELLGKNPAALTGATILFGSTISRQMVPALYEGAKAAADSAKSLSAQAEMTQGAIKTTGNLPKVYESLAESMKNGTATQEEFDAGLKSLDQSLTSHRGQLVGIEKEHGKESEAVRIKKGKIDEVTGARKTLITTMALQRQASSKVAAANAIEAAGVLDLKGAYNFLKLSIQEYAAAQALAATASGGVVGIFGKLRKAAFTLSLSLRVLGTAFLAAIPIIGQVILVGSLLFDFLKKFWPEQDKVSAATDKATASLENFKDAYDDLQTRIAAGGTEPVIEEARTLTGIYETLGSRVNEIIGSIEDPSKEKLEEAKEELRELDEILARGEDRGSNYFTRLFQGEGLTTFFRSTNGLQTSAERLKKTVDKIVDDNKKKDRSFEILDENSVAAIVKFTTASIDQLENFGSITAEEREKLEIFRDTIQKFPMTQGAVKGFFQSLGTDVKTLTAAVTNSEDAFSKYRTETAKYEKKNITPFDGIINQAVVLNNEFQKLTDEQAAALARSLPEAFRETFGTSKASVKKFTDELLNNQDTLLKFPGLLQAQEFALDKLNKVRGQSSEGLRAAFAVEDEINRLKKENLTAEKNLINLATASTDEKKRVVEIDRELAALDQEAESSTVREAQILVSQVQEKQKLLGLQQKITSAKRAEFEASSQIRRMDQQITNSANKLSRDTTLTAKQESTIYEDERKERLKLIEDEGTMRIKAIEMEYDLLEAQAKLLRERLKAAGVSTEAIDSYITNLGVAEKAAKASARKQTELAKKRVQQQGVINKAEVEQSVLDASNQGSTVFDRAVNVSKEGGMEDLDTMNEKIQAMRNMVTPMMEELSKLGPQGEIASAVAQGAFTIADSFTYAAEMTGTNMEKMGAKAKAIADTIGAINSIMQASMQASIAKIDQQIAAEKKRDGKSAASVAKLQALEKKKDAMARKAFETNKKMLMAQTIANTAAGVMATMKDGGFFASPLAMIVAAMGAAQLAIIAGTSYQSGGSGGGGGMPSAVTVGERKSSTDLARSQGAGGELAYFRGGRGTGGPENYTPAFAGYKNRAEGGNTAYMVGEQGPELFVPDRPGTIVPNDDVQTAGSSVNANINISAIDAAGVEDVLMNQRGNIISMIREAANSQGNTFLEEINVAEL